MKSRHYAFRMLAMEEKGVKDTNIRVKYERLRTKAGRVQLFIGMELTPQE